MHTVIRGTRFSTAAAGILLAWVSLGCGDRAPEGIHGPWEGAEEHLGDTTLVRTVAGSVWGDTMVLVPEVTIGVMDGEKPYVFGAVAALDVDSAGRLFVLDRLEPEVRVFSAEGEHLFSFGQEGEGPGEFLVPNHLRVLPGGDVLIRDRRRRFSRFSPTGELRWDWPILSGYSSNRPFYVMPGGRVLNPNSRGALAAYSPEGEKVDSIPPPTRGFEYDYLEVRSESTRALYERPFAPQENWTMTRDGRVIFGNTGTYAVERWEHDGSVLRIERDVLPVPVNPEEAARVREGIEDMIRQSNDPDWTWHGPGVPSEKPPWRWVMEGFDGSIWVLRSTVAEEVPNPYWDPGQSEPGEETTWMSPMVADVFDQDGRYLGPVKLPDRFQLRPPPHLTRERIWMPTFHELGHPQVVRFSLVPQKTLASRDPR